MVRPILGALIPAAMITASAVVLQGVWAEHRSLADRVRACSNELRARTTESARRQSLLEQLLLFRRRARLSTVAALSANGSVACFVTLMLSIALNENLHWQWLVIVAFVAGAAFLLVTITLLFGDLLLANRTLDIELRDHTLHSEKVSNLRR